MTRAWLLCLGTPKAGSCVHAKSNSRESGFTLIEVMLIIAILGVLMSIAIAAYQDYSIRAKVSEGVALIAGVKEAVSESLVASGNFPTSNADAGMVAANTILGTYVSSVGTGATDGGGDGLILISFFVIFLYYTFGMAQKGEFEAEVPEEALHMSTAKAIVYTVIGLVALPIGGHFIVEGATALARVLGWSEAVIGLVIVGVGTSLPEVAASAVAAYKGKTGIAIGNAVGSNIFNIFWVLGLSALIKPIPFDLGLNIDVLVTIFASVALFGSTFLGTPRQVARAEGAIFLLVYALYVGLRVVFGEELVQFFR